MPPRRPSRPDIEEGLPPVVDREDPLEALEPHEVANYTARDLSLRAVNATLILSQQIGHLAANVASLEERLANDYEDTKTHELRQLKSRDKWFRGIITAVLTAVVIAEVMRMLHLGGMGG